MDNDMDLAFEGLQKYEVAEQKKTDTVMARVKSMVSERVYIDISEYITELGYVFDFKIVIKPVGNKQSESDYSFKYLYVDQTCNGGYLGDDFSGTVCIPLDGGLHLMFNYSM